MGKKSNKTPRQEAASHNEAESSSSNESSSFTEGSSSKRQKTIPETRVRGPGS